MIRSHRPGAAYATAPLRSAQWAWLSVGLAVLLQLPQLPVGFSLGLCLMGLRPALASRRGPLTALSRPGLALGLLLVLLATGIAYHGQWLSREAGMALATGLLVLKAMESRLQRDMLVVSGFACFVMMSSLLASQGLAGTVLAAISLLAPLCCMQALQQDPAAIDRPLWRDAWPVARLLILALPWTVIAFLAVPRLSSPLWGNSGEALAQTGLSSHLSPGKFGQILNNDAPALRVMFQGPAPTEASRYFRAYVMWHFDGHDWSEATPTPSVAARTAAGPDPLDYEVIMEPDGQHHLPALDWPAGAVRAEGAGIDADGIVQRHDAVTTPLRYALAARASPPILPALNTATRSAGLQWPAGAAPRTRALGQQWQQQHLADEAIAQRALQFFRNQGFVYSLTPPTPSGDVTDGFLFTTRRGYCVHYASAFVLLMRAGGVPARVVSGYQGGYWSRLGHYLLIRQSDAHAWAEVWIASRHRWIRYDPTAMASPERINAGAAAIHDRNGGWTGRSWLDALRNHWDLVNQVWDRSVIGYDQRQQTRWLDPATPARGGWRIDPRLGLLLILIGLGAVGVCWAQRATPPPEPLLRAWQQLTRHLAGKGLPIRPGEGPHAYLERIAQALPSQRKEIERLRTLYLLARYATARPEPDQIRAVQRAVRNFRRKKLSELP